MKILDFYLLELFKISHDHRLIELYIIDQIKSSTDAEVVNFIAPEEIHFNSYNELHSICKEKKIKLNYLFGAMSNDVYHSRKQHDPQNDIRTYLWPTFFFKNTLHHIKPYLDLDLNPVLNDYTFKHSVICLNGIGKKFRCKIVDELAKHNLIKGNAISWNNVSFSNDLDSYLWQYWKPIKLTLTENVEQCNQHRQNLYHTFNQFSVPLEWHSSFMHVVPETAIDIPFITEKTVMPLFYKKIFITVASKKFYFYFKKLGFKLYDELFDYSFDELDDYEKRIESIVDQISYIVNDKSKFEYYYKILEDKIDYNQKRAIQFSRFTTSFPSVKKFYSYLNEKKVYPKNY